MTTTEDALRTDDALALVADGERRRIIRHLIDYGDGAVSLEDLLCEAGPTDGDRATASVYSGPERLRTKLLHVHLPKLADAGVIEFDARSETVRYDGDEMLDSLVTFLQERDLA